MESAQGRARRAPVRGEIHAGAAQKGQRQQADARTAQTNLKTAEIQLKQAEVALEKKTVHSPFDGVVTRHMRELGEATDNFLPLLTLVDLSKVYLETYLPANRLRDVQPGQPVEVAVPDLPGTEIRGHDRLHRAGDRPGERRVSA